MSEGNEFPPIRARIKPEKNYLPHLHVPGTLVSMRVGSIALVSVRMFVLLAAEAMAEGLPEWAAWEDPPHSPIYITGDDGFTWSNGVSQGTGTKTNPFIIEGFEFVFQGSGSGISITDTTAYFVVRNVHVTGASIGISFSNVSHGKILDVFVERCSVGIRIAYSDNCAVERSTLKENGVAIVLYYSEDTKLSDLTYIDNDQKIAETKAPWLQGPIGTTVCISVLVPIAVLVILVVYFRMRPPERPGDQED